MCILGSKCLCLYLLECTLYSFFLIKQTLKAKFKHFLRDQHVSHNDRMINSFSSQIINRLWNPVYDENIHVYCVNTLFDLKCSTCLY